MELDCMHTVYKSSKRATEDKHSVVNFWTVYLETVVYNSAVICMLL